MENATATILAARTPDVERLATELRNLLQKAGDNSFLIVTAGEPWVQFMALPKQRALIFEAVGNEYLPKRLRLDADRCAKLVTLGFQTPEQTGANFSMNHSVAQDADFQEVATLAISVLFEVYRSPIDAPLKYELNLE